MEVAALDENRTGFVSASLLSEVLQQIDTKLTEEEIVTMVEESRNSEDEVNYTEFFEAKMNVRQFIT